VSRDFSSSSFLQFKHRPSNDFAPVHKITIWQNVRIREFYWKLWYGNNAVLLGISISKTFVGPELTIKAEVVVL
jgi:fatty acid synthase subunit beta